MKYVLRIAIIATNIRKIGNLKSVNESETYLCPRLDKFIN